MTFEDVNYLHDSPRIYSDIVSKDILNKLSLNSEAQSQTASQCSTWNIFRSSSTVRNCFISSLQAGFSWPTNLELYPASGSSPNVLKQVWDQSPERFVRNKKMGLSTTHVHVQSRFEQPKYGSVSSISIISIFAAVLWLRFVDRLPYKQNYCSTIVSLLTHILSFLVTVFVKQIWTCNAKGITIYSCNVHSEFDISPCIYVNHNLQLKLNTYAITQIITSYTCH